MHVALLALLMLQSAGIVLEEEATPEPPKWQTKTEDRRASGRRLCYVYREGLTFSFSLIESGEAKAQAVRVGMSEHRDAHLRIDDGAPVRLEDGALWMFVREGNLGRDFDRGTTLYLEWQDHQGRTREESASLEGFAEARSRCWAWMGW